MKRQHFLLLPLTLALTQVWAADEPVEQDSALAPVVVTGTQQQKANTVKFNPKATIQPMPAGDGADLLQSVPNMSIIRKGGSSGAAVPRFGRFAPVRQCGRPVYLRRLRYAYGSADRVHPSQQF